MGQGKQWQVALLPGALDTRGKVCVAIDVLRASSTVVTALALGAQEVVPAASLRRARSLARRSGYLLCGERGGLPPPHFHLGNSPAQLRPEVVGGKGLVLTTSNGTRLLASLAEAKGVLVGCLLNREAVARAALAVDGPVALVCAGEGGGRRLALEDVIGAGAILDAALSLEPSLILDDSARLARWAFLACRDDLAGALANTQHGLYLLSLGLRDDVNFCARLDVWDVVPRMEARGPNIAALRP
jgi:2-phosphosulfolactate phosphatase